MALATYTENYTTLSVDMRAPIAEVRRLGALDPLTRGTKLRTIAGFGSYSKNKASGATDTGSGHVDFNAEAMTDAQAQRWVTYLRRVGFMAYFRPRSWWSWWKKAIRKPGWQRHIHCGLYLSADASPALRAQFKEWLSDGDGLVGPEADNGDRTVVGRTWAAYIALAQAVTLIGMTVSHAANAHITPNIAVGLTAPIHMSRLKVGAPRTTDVSRYQAALWNRLPGMVRVEFIQRYGLKRTDLYDGIYGNVTAAMTDRLYTLIKLSAATQPGPKMMRHLGFTNVAP